jgi:peptide/nickel transport system ATP-binding protein
VVVDWHTDCACHNNILWIIPIGKQHNRLPGSKKKNGNHRICRITMKILDISRLRAYYITKEFGKIRSLKAVDDVSFEVNDNQIFGIAGESGSGKTTLIKVLSRMSRAPLRIQGGNIFYNTGDKVVDVLGISNDEFSKLRSKVISYIPQSSMSVLNPLRKIRDIFSDFISPNVHHLSGKEYSHLVHSHLSNLGLPIEVLNSYPHELSGGMKQRITIALSTILTPKIIIADEPTTALDVVIQRGIIQLFKKIQETTKSTIIMVTHDMGVHAYLSERLAIMYAGKIVEIGDVKNIFSKPIHPYTKYLISSLPYIGNKERKTSIPGAPPDLVNPPKGCHFNNRCPYVQTICRTEDPVLETTGPDRSVACFRKDEINAE